jgi:hypothetical protein
MMYKMFVVAVVYAFVAGCVVALLMKAAGRRRGQRAYEGVKL